MKTTLTKSDPVGWYLCDRIDNPAECGRSRHWDGAVLSRSCATHIAPCDLNNFTNFRLLVEAPDEYLTIHERGEQFFGEWAKNPVANSQAIFERHISAHVIQLSE